MPARQFVTSAVIAVFLAFQSLFYAVSFGSLIFAGPLEPFRSEGVALVLTGSVIFALLSAISARFQGIWYGNETVTAVALAIGVGALASQNWPSPEIMGATAFLMLVAATTLTGAVLWVLGQFGLAGLVRIIPHPVIGGFLAASGCLLVTEAALLVVPGAEVLGDLLKPGAFWVWAPFTAAALVMVAMSRVLPQMLVLPVTIVVYLAGFAYWLNMSGTTLEEARQAGLLLDSGGHTAGFWEALGPARFAAADPSRLVPMIPAILSVPALAVLSTLMNLSAIELTQRTPLNLNGSFRNAGWANFVIGLIGGIPGHQSASTLQLTHGLRTNWVVAAGGAAVMLGAVLLFGRELLTLLPLGVFALMLSFLGVAILWRWIVVEAWRMTLSDMAIVLLILLTTLTLGIFPAVALGVVTSTVLFAVAYSRVDVVRSGASGRQRLSNAERSEEEIDTILTHGDETLVYELHGYLFFGTAERLFLSVTRAIDASDRPIRRVIFDLRRVVGLDTSTANMFAKLVGFAHQNDVEILISGPAPVVNERLRIVGLLDGAVRIFGTLSEALDWVETDILAGNGGPVKSHSYGFAELFRRVIAALPPAAQSVRERHLAAGETLFERGATSHSLFFLNEGRLSAQVEGPDGTPRTVAVFMPGAVVGEMGFYTGEGRSATVVADAASHLIVIASEDVERVAVEDPELLADFHAAIARLLARRLGRTTALAVALDR